MFGKVSLWDMTFLRAISVAVLLVSVLLPVAVRNVVLCFGADGHVLLEVSHNGHCGTPTSPRTFSRPQTGLGLSGVDHCGPCRDIPMFTADTREHPITLVSTPAQPDGRVLPSGTSCVAAFTGVMPTLFFTASPSGPECSPTLTALRTVILLI